MLADHETSEIVHTIRRDTYIKTAKSSPQSFLYSLSYNIHDEAIIKHVTYPAPSWQNTTSASDRCPNRDDDQRCHWDVVSLQSLK